MEREALLIPLLIIGLILGVYFGAVIILTNLAHTVASQAGTTPTQSLISTQISISAALITSVGTLLIGLVAGLLLFPAQQPTKQTSGM